MSFEDVLGKSKAILLMLLILAVALFIALAAGDRLMLFTQPGFLDTLVNNFFGG